MPHIRRTLSSPRAQHITRKTAEYAAVGGALWLQADRMGHTLPHGHKTRDLLVATLTGATAGGVMAEFTTPAQVAEQQALQQPARLRLGLGAWAAHARQGFAHDTPTNVGVGLTVAMGVAKALRLRLQDGNYDDRLQQAGPARVALQGPLSEEVEYRLPALTLLALNQHFLSGTPASLLGALIKTGSSLRFGAAHLNNKHAAAWVQALVCYAGGQHYLAVAAAHGLAASIGLHMGNNFKCEIVNRVRRAASGVWRSVGVVSRSHLRAA